MNDAIGPSTGLCERMNAAAKSVGGFYQEREEVVRVLMVAFLSQTNALLVGPPGTAKSHVVRSLVSHISGARFCDKLMTPFTTLDELAGPPKISALRDRDVFERNHAGTAADCHVFFPDETYRSSSAALNALLTMINEKTLDGKPIPMRLAVGATNMLPSEEGLEAIDDRFLLRMYIPGDLKDSSFDLLLSNAADLSRSKYLPKISETFSLEDWEKATEECRKVILPKEVREVLLQVKKLCQEKNIYVSSRRWVSLVKVLQANAWLDGCTQINVNHIGILKHGLWRKIEDRDKVSIIIDSLDFSDIAWITKVSDEVLRDVEAWKKLPPQDKVTQASKIAGKKVTALAAIAQKLQQATSSRAQENAQLKIREINSAYDKVKEETTRLMGF